MSGTVDYVKVVDLLTDTIKELNQPCVEAAPAVPAERTAEERKQDAAAVLRELLHELEGGGAAGAAAGRNASSQRYKNDYDRNNRNELGYDIDGEWKQNTKLRAYGY